MAQDRKDKSEKHQYEVDFYKKYVEYNREPLSMLNATRIENGKAYIDELELR